eukprot:CAMPEP_0204893414 /NCGR_PEP_ID=MMETSP1349-20130617/31449_1 /ASSEMBLY_ACC=CAM_ASM_000710 /TAXON_ID=215587 /ORGANISM="Aplanochytrium stocchinoi, Strain GSBS06" /LENGTH=50 /DNA_ID=CAMNT_0052059995 /DNA_START=141 /DNA_END=293 /DNA_ORIENTATION=-
MAKYGSIAEIIALHPCDFRQRKMMNAPSLSMASTTDSLDSSDAPSPVSAA